VKSCAKILIFSFKKKKKKKKKKEQTPSTVTQDCNSSYSRGGDWEDCGLRLAQGKSSQDPISTHVWVKWHMPVIQLSGKNK
jgi:hypothetical protein